MIGYRVLRMGTIRTILRNEKIKKNTLVSSARSKVILWVLFKSTFDTCHGLLILDWHYTAFTCKQYKENLSSY